MTRLLGRAGVCFAAVFAAAFLLLSAGVLAEGLISIDTDKKYEGMKTSFAKGYMPSIKKNTMTLVVPFVVKLPLEDDSLLVGVSFEREENSPFVFRNYQKRVKKSGAGIYLYQCKIKLQKNRVNGQYPLHLTVQAQSAEGLLCQEFTIYAEISDGRAAPPSEEYVGAGTAPLEETGTEEQPGGPKEEILHQPRILLAQGSLQGEAVQAGGSAVWAVTAKNCSSSQAIENVKVTLLAEGNEISFEKNAWYFERVAAGGSMDLSQTVGAAGKAAAGPVALQLLFEYEDGKGNAYSTTETARILIKQAQQAALANLDFPDSIYEADTEQLSFQVQNTGLAVIYNVRVRLEAAGLFPEKEMFLGTIEPGTSADGEIAVFAGTLDMDAEGNTPEGNVEKYGDTAAEVIFTYEDEQGGVTEQVVSFHTAIKKPETVELKVENPQEETNQWWITVLFFVFLVLILIIIRLYLRMKYYQRRRDVYERT